MTTTYCFNCEDCNKKIYVDCDNDYNEFCKKCSKIRSHEMYEERYTKSEIDSMRTNIDGWSNWKASSTYKAMPKKTLLWEMCEEIIKNCYYDKEVSGEKILLMRCDETEMIRMNAVLLQKCLKPTTVPEICRMIKKNSEYNFNGDREWLIGCEQDTILREAHKILGKCYYTGGGVERIFKLN